MRTLIVEDDLATRFFLEKVFSSYGKCRVAVDGKEALEAFKIAWKSTEPYDLVILDLILPRMDGLELLNAIRRHEAEHGCREPEKVKVIVATASTSPKDIFMAAGDECDGYLVKPFDKQMLIEEVRKMGLIP